jgi:hypothetical protein
MALLDAYPDSRELALALSGGSQLAMLAERPEEAIALGERAIALGRRIGDRETVAHAQTNVGTAMLGTPRHEDGRALLEEAHVLAVEAGHDDHAARALVNLATTTMVRRRDDPRIPADLERALAYARPRGLDGYVQYLLGGRANVRLRTGEWAGAEADAREALAIGDVPGVSLCPTLLALGRLQARRGDDAAAATLAEAWRRAIAAREPHRLALTAAARAELGWLSGVGRPAPAPRARGSTTLTARGAGASSRSGCGGRARSTPDRRTSPRRTRTSWPATGAKPWLRGSSSGAPTKRRRRSARVTRRRGSTRSPGRSSRPGMPGRWTSCGRTCSWTSSTAGTSRAGRPHLPVGWRWWCR